MKDMKKERSKGLMYLMFLLSNFLLLFSVVNSINSV